MLKYARERWNIFIARFELCVLIVIIKKGKKNHVAKRNVDEKKKNKCKCKVISILVF